MMKLGHSQQQHLGSRKIVPEFNVASGSYLAGESKKLNSQDLAWLVEQSNGPFYSAAKPIPFLKRPYLNPWWDLAWLVTYEKKPIGTIFIQGMVGIFSKINIMLDFHTANNEILSSREFQEFIRLFTSATFLGFDAEIAEFFFRKGREFAFLENFGAYPPNPIWVVKPFIELFTEPLSALCGYEITADIWWQHNNKESDSDALKYVLGKRQRILEEKGQRKQKLVKKSVLRKLISWG